MDTHMHLHIHAHAAHTHPHKSDFKKPGAHWLQVSVFLILIQHVLQFVWKMPDIAHMYYHGKLANENAITRILLPCSTKKCNTRMIG